MRWVVSRTGRSIISISRGSCEEKAGYVEVYRSGLLDACLQGGVGWLRKGLGEGARGIS